MSTIFGLIKWLLAFIFMLLICGGVLYIHNWFRSGGPGEPQLSFPELPVATNLPRCAAAPFVSPSSGWTGVLYGDSILGTVNHSGLDIFGLEGNGVTPVYAAYDGYLTRRLEWTSAVIIRHPQDPLQPNRQIWTYYTHMADDTSGRSYILNQIAPGTEELFVKQGTLLGYQGNYKGQSWRAIDTHLHFSIVLDDGQGQFLNETDRINTLDPSPYLGMRLNSSCADRPPVCRPDFACEPLARR